MPTHGALGTGISAHERANDLSDLAAELNMIEQLGFESIERPTYDMDIVVGGKIHEARLLQAGWTVDKFSKLIQNLLLAW